MSGHAQTAKVPTPGDTRGNWGVLSAVIAVIAVILVVIYKRTADELYINWMLTDSYYTHGFIVPFVSLYFIWRERAALAAIP
ncbi:MAG: hypothetical protein SGI88_18185, partial [Candidatus Hydrogenedentes bacterium]|nr:hypothetical protein [Candidatus Hydrogenedentota bacterium]